MPSKFRHPSNLFGFSRWTRLFQTQLDDLPVSNIVDVFDQMYINDLMASAYSSTEINLTWSNEFVSETGYEIQRSTDNVNWDALTTTVANVVTYLDGTAIAGNTYYYRIRAINAETESLWSNIASLYLKDWLLSGGVWDDNGIWYDTEIWID